MALRKRIKKLRKRLKTKSELPKQIEYKKLTGYGARTDPICTVCKHHKPLNWWVKICADITCKGRYKAPKRKLLLMKPIKKIQKKLERRGRGHVELIKNLRLGRGKNTPENAYKAPGSRNSRKQG